MVEKGGLIYTRDLFQSTRGVDIITEEARLKKVTISWWRLRQRPLWEPFTSHSLSSLPLQLPEVTTYNNNNNLCHWLATQSHKALCCLLPNERYGIHTRECVPWKLQFGTIQREYAFNRLKRNVVCRILANFRWDSGEVIIYYNWNNTRNITFNFITSIYSLEYCKFVRKHFEL